MDLSFLTPESEESIRVYAQLINESYELEEAGFWKPNHQRITIDELRSLVSKGEIIIATDNCQIVGGCRINVLDSTRGEMCMLCVRDDYRGKGLMSQLINFMENTFREKKLTTSCIEILKPTTWTHPKKEQFISYYESNGYVSTGIADFLDYYPDAKESLATPVEFYLMEKDLTKETFPKKTDVITTYQLNAGLLEKLFLGKITAIIIKNFSNSLVCKQLSEKLSIQESIEKYMYIISNGETEKKLFLGVSRLGIPFSSTFRKDSSSKEVLKYKSMVKPSLARIRSFASPYLSPIDKLRVVMDEEWPSGANLGVFDGMKMNSGIVRYTEADAELSKKAHVDSLIPEFAFKEQFAANIYLEVPDSDGELIVWSKHKRATPEEVHDSKFNDYLWGLDENEAIRIRPEQGDLVLFPTQLPHATNTFKSGKRISLQTFFAIDKNNKIQLWC